MSEEPLLFYYYLSRSKLWFLQSIWSYFVSPRALKIEHVYKQDRWTDWLITLLLKGHYVTFNEYMKVTYSFIYDILQIVQPKLNWKD